MESYEHQVPCIKFWFYILSLVGCYDSHLLRFFQTFMMKLALLLEWDRVLSLVVYCLFFIIVLIIIIKKSYSVNFNISWRSSNETTKKEENLYASSYSYNVNGYCVSIGIGLYVET